MSYVYCIRGPVYSRKSTIALSIPGNKFVFDLEQGMHRAQQQYQDEELELWTPAIDLSVLTHFKGDRVVGKKERWLEFTEKYIEVLKRDDIQVIIWDTAKELWTCCHQSILQEKQDKQLEDARAKAPNLPLDQVEDKVEWRQSLLSIEYSMPNERMAAMINFARAFNKDLVLINHERDIYGPTMIKGQIEMMPTGRKELDGYKHTLDLADWVVITTREDKIIAGSTLNTEIIFKARVDKCPLGAQVVGQTLTNLTLPAALTLANALAGNGHTE